MGDSLDGRTKTFCNARKSLDAWCFMSVIDKRLKIGSWNKEMKERNNHLFN